MILDNETMFVKNGAFGDTPMEIDLGPKRPGPGEPIVCFITVHAALTGATGLDVLDAAESPADEALMSLSDLPEVGKTRQFELPSNTQQFVTVALAGAPSAGSWSCGIVLEGVQTND